MSGPPSGRRADPGGDRGGLSGSAGRPDSLNEGSLGLPDDLGSVLLSDSEAATLPAVGSRRAAVIVPVRDWGGRPEILFTERPDHLPKHAGEVSFPGGKVDPTDEGPREAALRELEEEVGLAPDTVEVVGALAPVGTFVTAYRIQPFVGIVRSGAVPVPDPSEVAAVFGVGIEELVDAYGMRRLVRRGVPIRTPTFEVAERLIWGATARILTDLMRRIGAL